ncbi:MAG: C4-dicarboxylate ABC transporter [Proteobacteria bacterium]|nr:MAG: C4-dicarboxylate ABC transporter [Pseudomonadota bacterium]
MNTCRFQRALGVAAALIVSMSAGTTAHAQEVVLKLHHFLPAGHQNQKTVIEPWAEKINKESDGRIKIEIYPSMQLGGKPPQLLDQVRDGLTDIAWSLPGYTAGRFPKISVFELPFMVSNAEATSQAVQAYYEQYAKDEFADYHVLWFHTHARGLIHTREAPVRAASDVDGKKLRAPNRSIGNALEALGASPIFMPVPALPEALSKGVVDGAVIPWEIVPALKVHELSPNHAETPGDRGLYTAIFVFAMNKQKYESLPDELKKVIDDNSGIAMSKLSGQRWDSAEVPGKQVAVDRGNEIVEIPSAEMEIIRERTSTVTRQWIEDMGDEGQSLYDAANELLRTYSGD